MKHTPTPWRAFDNAGKNMQSYSQSSGITGEGDHRMQIVAGCFNDIGGDDLASANAAFIVRAVNSHDMLVAALKRCIERMNAELADPEDIDDIQFAIDALAAAEGENK